MDPLAAKRRETKKEFLLRDTLSGAIAVFENEYEEKNIQINFSCSDEIKFFGWKQDIYTIMVNLLDNSLFWIDEKKCVERIVNIFVSKTEKGFTLDYTDSGPGISEDLLQSGVIFEPEFTTKPGGTGLGLPIAGEAAARNNLSLTAVQRDKGVHFILRTEE